MKKDLSRTTIRSTLVGAAGGPSSGFAERLISRLATIRALASLIVCADLASQEYQDWIAVGRAGRRIISDAEQAMDLLDERERKT